MGIRITTWNVNGIRNPFGYQPWREKRTFQAMFDILDADIVVMQETKIQRKDLTDDMVLVPGWDVYFSLPRHKKGYSGVAIYTRNATCAPIRAEEGITGILCPPKSKTPFRQLPKDEQIGGYPLPGQLSGNVDELMLDSEGRCVILEFPAFVLLGVYSPANRDESRAEFRIEFLEALDIRVRNLVREGKRIILTGDLNVIRSEIDSTNVAETLRKEDLSMEEWQNLPSRRLFNQLIFGGKVQGDRDESREQPVLWDLCREFHPTREGMNTCWDTKRNTRPANNGSRIDYVLCSDSLKEWFAKADIQEGLMGSDHCPVFATLKDSVMIEGNRVPLLDLVNPPGIFKDGRRIRDWCNKDVLSLSAKLIPEFDRRQSIRDMFTKNAGPGLPTPKQASLWSEGYKSSSGDKPMGDSINVDNVANIESIKLQDTSGDPNSSIASSGTKNSNSLPQWGSDALSANKRQVGSSDVPIPSSKRSKVSAYSNPTTTSLSAAGGKSNRNAAVGAKEQKTLQGFFKPRANASTKREKTSQTSGANADAPVVSPKQTTEATNALPTGWTTLSTPSNTNIPSATSDGDWPTSLSDLVRQRQPKSETPTHQMQERVFDPIQAKESWSKLLGKRVLPRCEHNEPCISLVTKKPGVNCGRSFYICPRPLGPSGEKEKSSEWRCGTFIWSSDWNGSPS